MKKFDAEKIYFLTNIMQGVSSKSYLLPSFIHPTNIVLVQMNETILELPTVVVNNVVCTLYYYYQVLFLHTISSNRIFVTLDIGFNKTENYPWFCCFYLNKITWMKTGFYHLSAHVT